MITLYHHPDLKLNVVTRDGMPALVITDDGVHDFEQYVCSTRLLAGRPTIVGVYEIVLRCPDPSVGWTRL